MTAQLTSKPYDVLNADRVETPSSLANVTQLTKEAASSFMSARNVFYPGSGYDGQAIALFGRTGSASCIVHVDQNITAEQLVASGSLKMDLSPDGYIPIVVQHLAVRELSELFEMDTDNNIGAGVETRDALWVVFEKRRFSATGDKVSRIWLLHICADAVSTYGNLWARTRTCPHAILLQDHRFGGNWSSFGAAGALHNLAERSGCPEWLLVGEGTKVWPGYVAASGATDPAGDRRIPRTLYRKTHRPEE